ncbi:hypothetical protein C7E12_18015, partial [Stenotrophomonas maltophilia]
MEPDELAELRREHFGFIFQRYHLLGDLDARGNVEDLRREFPAGDDVIAVLRDVNLDIHAGEMVAIVGQSGSGKSTLMNILGCLDRPTRGSYQV